MTGSTTRTVFVATVGYPYEGPSETRVYAEREDAIEWLADEGLDPDELEEYSLPEVYETATIDRNMFKLKEREVR